MFIRPKLDKVTIKKRKQPERITLIGPENLLSTEDSLFKMWHRQS